MPCSAVRCPCATPSRRDAPGDLAASPEGNELFLAEGKTVRNRPGIAQQSDLLVIAAQAVEVRAEFGGKALQTVQSARGLEDFCIGPEGCVRGKDSGAAAGRFLRRACMGGAVGAEKKLGAAARRGG